MSDSRESTLPTEDLPVVVRITRRVFPSCSLCDRENASHDARVEWDHDETGERMYDEWVLCDVGDRVVSPR